MYGLRYLFVLLVISSAVFATGEFSTGGAELLKFKGYGMGRFDIYGEEDADPDMGFSAIADVTWIPTLNEWLDAKIEFKLKPTKYDGGSHDRNIVLFLEVLTLNAQVTDGFAITAGQFKRPFGYNYFRSGSSMYFADRAIMTGMSGFSSYGKRDIGVNLGLDFNPVEIDLAVTNGAGENRPENDSHKQFTARFQVDPVDWMTLGAAVGLNAGGIDTDTTDTWNSTGMDFFTNGSISMGESSEIDFAGEYMSLGYAGDAGESSTNDGTAMSFMIAPEFGVDASVLTSIQPAVRYETTSPAYLGDTDPLNDKDAIDFCLNFHTGSKNTFQLGGRNYSFEDEDTEGYTDMYINWRMKF